MKDRDLADLAYDERGLIPAVVQDFNTGAVLMVAWMNGDALVRTRETGYTHFWSRSRQKLWKKGETSGHVQKVREIRADCDGDTLLVLVEQTGPACHTNSYSCFSRQLFSSGIGGPGKAEIIDAIYRIILDRKHRKSEGSYVLELLDGGGEKIIDKMLEEARECAAASRSGDRKELTHEIADLWFHTLVLLGEKDLPPAEVFGELARRYRARDRD